MHRFVLSLAVAATACAAASAVRASDSGSSNCLIAADVDSQLDRVPDCMKMGRHVRVGTSISRGTATLSDGFVPTRVSDPQQSAAERRRVTVPVDPIGMLWSGLFGR